MAVRDFRPIKSTLGEAAKVQQESLRGAGQLFGNSMDALRRVISGQQSNLNLRDEQETKANDMAIQANLKRFKTLGELKAAKEAGVFDPQTMTQRFGNKFTPKEVVNAVTGLESKLEQDAFSRAQLVGSNVALKAGSETAGIKAMNQALINAGVDPAKSNAFISKWVKENINVDTQIQEQNTANTLKAIASLDPTKLKTNADIELTMKNLGSQYGTRFDLDTVRKRAEQMASGQQADTVQARAEQKRIDQETADSLLQEYATIKKRGGDTAEVTAKLDLQNSTVKDMFNRNSSAVLDSYTQLSQTEKEKVSNLVELNNYKANALSAQAQFEIGKEQNRLEVLKAKTFDKDSLNKILGKDILSSIQKDGKKGAFGTVQSIMRSNKSWYVKFPENALDSLHTELAKDYGVQNASIYLAQAYADTAHKGEKWWGTKIPIDAMRDMAKVYAAQDQAILEQSNKVQDVVQTNIMRDLNQKANNAEQRQYLTDSLRKGVDPKTIESNLKTMQKEVSKTEGPLPAKDTVTNEIAQGAKQLGIEKPTPEAAAKEGVKALMERRQAEVETAKTKDVTKEDVKALLRRKRVEMAQASNTSNQPLYETDSAGIRVVNTDQLKQRLNKAVLPSKVDSDGGGIKKEDIIKFFSNKSQPTSKSLDTLNSIDTKNRSKKEVQQILTRLQQEGKKYSIIGGRIFIKQ